MPSQCIDGEATTPFQDNLQLLKNVITINETIEDRLISGTYCHPILVPDIAGWISTEFKIKAHSVTLGYISFQYKQMVKEANEAREAAENLVAIKQFAIENTNVEAQQQQLDDIENELEIKTMLVDTMQQGSVDARQQKQFLEGVVYQADGVIGEMGDTLEQKEGYIGKVTETLDEEKNVYVSVIRIKNISRI